MQVSWRIISHSSLVVVGQFDFVELHSRIQRLGIRSFGTDIFIDSVELVSMKDSSTILVLIWTVHCFTDHCRRPGMQLAEYTTFSTLRTQFFLFTPLWFSFSFSSNDLSGTSRVSDLLVNLKLGTSFTCQYFTTSASIVTAQSVALKRVHRPFQS